MPVPPDGIAAEAPASPPSGRHQCPFSLRRKLLPEKILSGTAFSECGCYQLFVSFLSFFFILIFMNHYFIYHGK